MAMESGGSGRRMPLLAAAFVVGAIATVAFLQGLSSASRVPEEPAEQMVLRLHDLPLGYFPFDFSEGAELEFECDELRPASPGPRMRSFVQSFAPRGCLGLYVQVYRPHGTASAAVAATGAMDVGSVAGAETGFGLAAQLLAKLAEEPLEEVPAAQTVGDASRLFHWRHVPALFRNTHLGSFLVWRSGSALAAVFASAGSLATSDRLVAELAERQQVHVASPTPYTRAERNSSEVRLDDPSLTFPVHWLGRNFDPRHGLPPIRLQGGGVPGQEALPWQKLQLGYSRGIYLDSWTSRGWKRFLETPISRTKRTWHCTDSTQIRIPGGHATIFAAYRQDFDTCPKRPPHAYFAFAHLDGTVTAVNFIVGCSLCDWVPGGPYNSLAGMKAIVRNLQLRPRRIYSAQP